MTGGQGDRAAGEQGDREDRERRNACYLFKFLPHNFSAMCKREVTRGPGEFVNTIQMFSS